MTPEELDVYVAKLKEEMLAKHREKNRKRMHEWRLKNPGKAAEINRLYRKRHPGRDAERNRLYRAKYPDRFAESKKAYRKRHPDKIAELNRRYSTKYPDRVANRHLKKYGITLDEKEAVFENQGRCCGICKTTNPGKKGWCVDHCHATDKIRGILCGKCNLMLGHGNDDISILEAAITYLEHHNGKRDQGSVVSSYSSSNTQNGSKLQQHTYCY
jgi:hypothetical protein